MNETTKGSLSEYRATGADLERLIGKMQDVLVGEPEHHVMMACISLAVAIQYPNVTAAQLVRAVKDASEHIAMMVSEFADPPPDTRMN